MQYARMDLLSYDNIDSELDRVFRLFCDASLIEFSLGSDKSEGDHGQYYWRQVREFRREHLTKFERLDLIEKATGQVPPDVLSDSGGSSGLDADSVAADSTEDQRLDVLYYFDVRADYFFHHRPDRAVLENLVPAKPLGDLYTEIKKVQQRIRKSQRVAGVVEWCDDEGGATNALFVTKAIKTPSVAPDEP
jgi:hypothetical protein